MPIQFGGSDSSFATVGAPIISYRRITCKEAADDARLRILSLLMKARVPPINFTPEESKALREPRSSSDLLILPADKGQATVLLDRADYDKKLQDMLDDTSTYKRLQKDPTPSLEWRMNSMLLKLHKEDQIPTLLYKKLHSSAGQLYGLPKVHKPGVPLCPIVSFVQSPMYHLSKHLSYLLAPLVGCTLSAVRNSKEFVEFVTTQTLTEDETLVPFDVVSLFTNIPTDLAIGVTHHRLASDDSLDECTLRSEVSSLS